MSHPLDGCWAKIDRANQHIKNLESEIAAFFDGHPYRVVGQFNNNMTEYIFTSFGPPPAPLNFAVVTGEVIHQLRSSLDHLIWALAVKHVGTPPNPRIQFPIYKDATKYVAVQGVSTSAEAIIETVQPYRKPEPAKDPLIILQDFNNSDKHRLLVVVSSVMAVPDSLRFSGKMADYEIAGFTPWRWSGHTVRASEQGAELLRIAFKRVPADMKIKADFRPQIAFEEFGSAGIKPIVPSLAQLRDAVVKTIKLFTGEF